jgi:hypothetical protein
MRVPLRSSLKGTRDPEKTLTLAEELPARVLVRTRTLSQLKSQGEAAF